MVRGKEHPQQVVIVVRTQRGRVAVRALLKAALAGPTGTSSRKTSCYGVMPPVADFGIAKALAEGDTEHLTSTGFAIGTPASMSPRAGMALANARAGLRSRPLQRSLSRAPDPSRGDLCLTCMKAGR